MLLTTISTADPTSGVEIDVPPGLLNGVKRATEILESELGELTEKFDIAARWQFVRDATAAVKVQLDLSAGQNQSTGVRGWTFSADTFGDDDTIRRALRPPMSKLATMLSALVKIRLELIRKHIQRDLEALATITEE